MEDILPRAIDAGLSEKDFFRMTPQAVYRVLESHTNRLKRESDMYEQHAWLTGQYVLAAISTAFGKHHNDYPDNPLHAREMKRTDFTEEEQMHYVEMLFGQLEHMQHNFEASHNK